MSATNRGSERHPDDFYSTPAWVTRAILPYLPIRGTVLEPGCGEGAILREVIDARGGPTGVVGIELDLERAKKAFAVAPGRVERGDFLSAKNVPKQFDLAIGNPPFKLALEFIDKALQNARTVAMLLPLSFLGSQKRADWHRANPSRVCVLSRRPSFRADGKTDATEYAWFVWAPTIKTGEWAVLSC